jgi:hypothetical protein
MKPGPITESKIQVDLKADEEWLYGEGNLFVDEVHVVQDLETTSN